MNRTSVFFSPLSIGITLVAMFGLGISILTFGGLGFSPGPLTAASQPGVTLQGFGSHEGFETQCALCHQPLRANQNELCIHCHADIGSQVTGQTGMHGKLPAQTRCADCHPDHRGRDFNPTQFALAHFDHNTTGFPLTGSHIAVTCSDCHANNHFQATARDCVACHQEPIQHVGMFGVACAECHSPESWKPATFNRKPFDHTQTSFTLVRHINDYTGQPMTCTSCHRPGKIGFDASPCIDCHTAAKSDFMQSHSAQFGEDCLQCHDGADRMHAFTHASFFPLDGKHASLACDSCHAGKRFNPTPIDCKDCHQEPAIHAGYFGLQCSRCHDTFSWSPSMLHAHTFPLDHGSQADVPCQSCHPNNYLTYTCYACHDHQAQEIAASHAKVGIAAVDLPNCSKCHPTGIVVPAASP
jgi:hypothetical protein